MDTQGITVLLYSIENILQKNEHKGSAYENFELYGQRRLACFFFVRKTIFSLRTDPILQA